MIRARARRGAVARSRRRAVRDTPVTHNFVRLDSVTGEPVHLFRVENG